MERTEPENSWSTLGNAVSFESGSAGKAQEDHEMAQKGAGGNSGAITEKGGDGAHGSTGTGRGGGKTGGGSTGKRDKPDARQGADAPPSEGLED